MAGKIESSNVKTSIMTFPCNTVKLTPPAVPSMNKKNLFTFISKMIDL